MCFLSIGWLFGASFFYFIGNCGVDGEEKGGGGKGMFLSSNLFIVCCGVIFVGLNQNFIVFLFHNITSGY